MLGFAEARARCPLIAILRGIAPAEAVAIGMVLVEAGFTMLEVPLNSPDPFESIKRLADSLGNQALIGAGTVVSVADVARLAAAGGQLVVAPNTDPAVITAAKRQGLVALPGFATATEAFVALGAGADGLKLFPAETNPPIALKALRAVLPSEVPIFPVGSITPESLAGYWEAGAAGFGIGSALYQPGRSIEDIGARAERFRAALREARGSRRGDGHGG